MNGSPQTPESPSEIIDQTPAPGVPMRTCKNCPEQFPAKKIAGKEKEFCTSKCRMAFFQHGNTPLKVIRKTADAYLKSHGKEELSKLLRALLRSKELRATMAAAGFIHKSQLRKPVGPRVTRLERRIGRLESLAFGRTRA